MKTINRLYKILLPLLVLITFSTKARLVYLGDDDIIQKNYSDGYIGNYRTVGFVMLNGKYYFTTPNGNLYESDGTEKNTTSIYHFPPQHIPYLLATNKYVYFGINNTGGDNKTIYRYSPSSGINVVTLPSTYNAPLNLNSIVVGGTKNLVSEIFTNYDKNALLIRHFVADNFYVYKIDDNTVKPEADLAITYALDKAFTFMPIGIATTLETYNNEVYFNGTLKATGVYETIIRIFNPSKLDNRKYEPKIAFELLKQKIYPYTGFFRTNNNIYSLFKVVDSVGNSTHRLFYFDKKSIKGINGFFDQKAVDFAIQKMGDDIYVSFLGNLWKFIETKSNFENIIKENSPTMSWDDITKNKRFLKVGNYYLFRRNGKLTMYNASLNVFKDISTAALAKNYNYFTQHNMYAYEGFNCFYFTQYINDKAVFIKYNPIANTYTPITFPEFKKETFNEIKAIYQQDNNFIFLTSYTGKKNKPVYKMFKYTEDGLPLTPMPTSVTNITVPVAKIDDQVIDLKKFDKKRFTEQITTIVANQGNQFEDITGETIPSEFNNKKKSTVLFEGFKNSTIIDYKSTSNLYRYEATSFTIKGKANAMAFLDLLDKEVQKITAKKGIKRIFDLDLKVNKKIQYLFEGNVGYDVTEIKFLELQAYCNIDFDNPDDAVFTIFIRTDKPARK